MFMNQTGNVRQLGNLKNSLLRTKTVECISAFWNGKQPNRLSSSNDGDRVNDEKFESSKPDENGAVKQSAGQASPEKNNKNPTRTNFIEVNLFGPKDARLPLPGKFGRLGRRNELTFFPIRNLTTVFIRSKQAMSVSLRPT